MKMGKTGGYLISNDKIYTEWLNSPSKDNNEGVPIGYYYLKDSKLHFNAYVKDLINKEFRVNDIYGKTIVDEYGKEYVAFWEYHFNENEKIRIIDASSSYDSKEMKVNYTFYVEREDKSIISILCQSSVYDGTIVDDTNNDEIHKNISDYFIKNSTHARIPGVPTAYVGEVYYFDEDGTYYWGANEHYNDQRCVAKMGLYGFDNDTLVLNELYELYLTDGELVKQSEPNGLSENELINYKEVVRPIDNITRKRINYVGVSDYFDNVYEYKMDDDTWFSNVGFDAKQNTWVEHLKQYKQKYSFLDGGYPFVRDMQADESLWIDFKNNNELSITPRSNEYEVLGTYSVLNNVLTCKINKCVVNGKNETNINGELVLEYDSEDWKCIVKDWKYTTDKETPSYLDAFFLTDFVKIGDEFCGATV